MSIIYIESINSILNKEIAVESINIAEKFNLAYTQLKIVNKLENYGVSMPSELYYPIPVWEPRGGYKIEKELLDAKLSVPTQSFSGLKIN